MDHTFLIKSAKTRRTELLKAGDDMSLKYYNTTGFGLGTIVEQKVAAESADDANHIFFRINEILRRIESEMSYFIAESSVSQLNSSDGKGSVKMDADTFDVLETADAFYRLSGGAFDVTAAPLTALWRDCINSKTVPEAQTIQSLMPLVSGSYLKLDQNSHTARIGSGQSVDPGGIGKGFAADAAMKAYRELGVTSALINLGGNVQTLGKKVDGEPWMIGIQNPRSTRGEFIAGLTLEDESAVTSGDYEKYFVARGKRYHHIIDPKTGYPADSGLISATVLSPSSMEADALSTAVFVSGLQRGMELIKQTSRAEGILITKEKTVFITRGLKDRFVANDDGMGYRFCFFE